MNRRQCRWCLMDLPQGWPKDQEACIHCMAYSQETGKSIDELIRSNIMPPHIAKKLFAWVRAQ